MHRVHSFVTAALAASCGIAAPAVGQSLQDGLMVSGYSDKALHVFDPVTGAPITKVPGMDGAQSQRFAPDGSLLVCLEELQQVVRFDGVTGQFLGKVVFDDPATPQDETGGLLGPTSAVIGPDGKLYVCGFDSDSVLRYDATTGAFLDVFVAPGTAGLDGPDAGMAFGPDNQLYVPSFNSNKVLRFDGATGAFVDVFIAQTNGNISRPRMLRWRSDGRLFLGSWGNAKINTYELDGTFIARFATPSTPTGILFEHDGNVLVTSDNTNKVIRFDGQTGANLGVLVPAGSDGLTGGTYLEFFHDQELHLRRRGGTAAGVAKLDVSNATPNGPLFFLAGFVNGSVPAGPCPDALIGIADLPVIAPIVADANGRTALTLQIPASVTSTVYFQLFELGKCRPSELVVVRP